MTDEQEDVLSMLRTLLAIRTAYATEIGAITDLDGDFDDLETVVNAIKALIPKQKLQTTGVARDKQDVKEELAEKAAVIAGAIMGFANKLGNHTLYEEVNYTERELLRMRDEELPDTCRIIFDRATDNAAALVARGVTAAMLTDLDNLITEAEDVSEAPRTATTKKGAATTEIDERIDEARGIARERLDPGMKIFKLSNPELYLVYRNGRKVVNSGHRKKSGIDVGELTYHVTDEANAPLAGVIVGVGSRVSTTDENGNGSIKGLTTGIKTAGFFKPGYLKKFETVTITKNGTTNVTVQLVVATTGTVSGVVTKAGLPAQANLTIVAGISTITTHTQLDGSYSLTDVPVGSQVVTCVPDADPANIQSHTTDVTGGGDSEVDFVYP